jgi:hypothetical protein
MMKTIVSFGANNTFSLDVAPVSNREHLQNHLGQVSEADAIAANTNPDGMHFKATLDKAKSYCEGGTVVPA